MDGKKPHLAKNDAGEQDKWDAKADKAAGEIMLNVHAMRLTRVSMLGLPRTILLMHGRLLHLFTSLTARHEQAMLKIKELHPADAKKPFTIYQRILMMNSSA